MIKRIVPTVVCSLAVLFSAAGCAPIRREADLRRCGLGYQLRELTDPRPNRAHILRVDLSDGKIEPAVVVAPDPDGGGPAEAALTNPLTLASDRRTLAFINTNPWDSFADTSGRKNRNWWEGQPVDIYGLAVSDGHMRSPAQTDGVTVWVGVGGRVILGGATADGSVLEGMAGFQQIVKEGVVVPPGGALHPRTAIGVDRSGSVMWLVVVDGRQEKYSEGMTVHELGCLMQDIGCWNAANMDGGGSSIMGLAGTDGRLHVVNSPSDRLWWLRRVRPLPMILTIREKTDTNISPTEENDSRKRWNRE